MGAIILSDKKKEETTTKEPPSTIDKKGALREITTVEWFWTIILTNIPIIGIVFCIYYWYFSTATPQPKKAYSKAMIYVTFLVYLLTILLNGNFSLF